MRLILKMEDLDMSKLNEENKSIPVKPVQSLSAEARKAISSMRSSGSGNGSGGHCQGGGDA